MGKNFLNDVLKPNIPVNLIQEKDIRVVIQNDNVQNDGWESNIKAIKVLIDSLPVGFIEKDTEDFLIREKIAFLLLDSIGELLKDSGIGEVFGDKKNNIEEISSFLEMASDYKWESSFDFQAFIKSYK
ncbi:hypothetical protein OF830_28315 [Bacillus paramycoides]|uniref:hypothetical protein n=1 Tax=Bacillus paramycoides TaxID=2026194 RepID=UPI0022432DA6|nr:hypothetical protein [Bacillus paramycoides]MCW9134656.1 hypothetical protein [Bacillus paramycoides]